LLFPLLARSHRHTRILRILAVDPSNSFAQASGLTPRAANLQAEGNAEKNTGKVEKKIGQIEKVFEK
jgi:hypothetical protein